MGVRMTASENTTTGFRVAPVPIQWHEDLPIYSSDRFLKTTAKEFGWLGGFDVSGQLRCYVAYTVLRKATVRMVRFRAETTSLAGQLDLQEEVAFLNGVVEYLRAHRADIIIPSGNTAIFRTCPDGALSAPYGTFINDLSKPEEVLSKDIRKTFRQNIRKAATEGVEIKSGSEYADIAYDLVAETLNRSKVEFKSRAEFNRLLSELGPNVKIFVAQHKGVVQACMVAPFSRYCAHNCYAGTRSEPVLGAMHMLHWEAMRDFRSMGVRRFDFQGVRIDPEKGSKQEGIANYKRGFGGELVKGFAWRYPLHPLKSKVYTLAIRWKGGDIVDQERHKLASTASQPAPDGKNLEVSESVSVRN